MNRGHELQRLRAATSPWDLAVIGGGATGIGIALDAASRGLQVILLEQADFGKGTSSRSTKLVHGGVRYLQQGNLTLVRDALRERSLLRRNAPHLVHDMPFLIPCLSNWQRWYYGAGLRLYDLLAASDQFGRSRCVSAEAARLAVPSLRHDLLRGAVVYHDGQFDDTRMLISMARTAHTQGACLLNYVRVTKLIRLSNGQLGGLEAEDQETGESLRVEARCVVNAAGPFGDDIRRFDDPQVDPMLAISQGVHLVLPRRFCPGNTAMIVPKTSDGRVIFIIPWHDHALVGTTDTPLKQPTLEPTPRPEEIAFLLETVATYLANPPTHHDVLSIFTGIRPLVKGNKSVRTAALSRDHVVRVSDSGLITIAGGKWTTVRKMAEDCVDRVVSLTGVWAKPCQTADLRLHGYLETVLPRGPRGVYGADLPALEALELATPAWGKRLHARLPICGSEVIWGARHEMARTVEDILARRTRALFLDSVAATSMAPHVARLLAVELGHDDHWCQQQIEKFRSVAEYFQPRARCCFAERP